MDIMIDLETMGTSSRAVIASIGAVAFDRSGPEPPDRISSKLFYTIVDMQSCIDIGLEVDGKTITWWLEQTPQAQQALLKPGVHIKTALQQLSDFVEQHTQSIDFSAFVAQHPQSMDDYIWSLPSTFDLVILQSAYRAIGSRPVWSHRQERCMRTLLSLFEVPKPNNEHAHHALWDAYYQAISVQRAYKLMASCVGV